MPASYVEIERKLEVIELLPGKDTRDEKNRVRATPSAFIDLIRVKDEVLSQHGEARGPARGGDVVQVASKVFVVGEDREGRGAVRGVSAGNFFHVEIIAQHTSGGRFSLEFRDHRGLSGALKQRLSETANRFRHLFTIADEFF